MKLITFLTVVLLLPTLSFAQPSKNRTPYLKQDFTPELTTYDLQLFNLNFNSMMYWYNTSIEIDSLYQLEKLKTMYYGKITGIQASNYETLQQIYENKKAVDKAIADEKDNQIKDLKSRNRKLTVGNVALSVGVVTLSATTIYFALFGL